MNEDARLEQQLQEQAENMANFCLGTGIAPSEYRQLTHREIEAFIKEANRRAKQRS